MANAITFSTPANTTISTITAAVEEVKGRIAPFIWKTDSGTEAAYRLHVLYEITGRLWQSMCHFRVATFQDKKVTGTAKKFADMWLVIQNLTTDDVSMYGISHAQFIDPSQNRRHIPQLGSRKDSALVSIGRVLDGQFHLGDSPTVVLQRHLAMRICLDAYAQVVQIQGSKTVIALRGIAPEHEWNEAPELLAAASIYPSPFGSEHHHFGYETLREVMLMADLWELSLRQMNDPES